MFVKQAGIQTVESLSAEITTKGTVGKHRLTGTRRAQRAPFVHIRQGRLALCRKAFTSSENAPVKKGLTSLLLVPFLAWSGMCYDVGGAFAETVEYNDTAPIYFGNGCFWGRQKDYIDKELQLGRPPAQLRSIVGYAGGTKAGPGEKVCYHFNDPNTVYSRLGHAEVVQVGLSEETQKSEKEFRDFAKVYFSQFQKTRAGMQRLDPQDAGLGYRNVVGLPGGVESAYFRILEEENKNGMDLRPGLGNDFGDSKAKESDVINVVWILDSNKLPFYRAEQYHQFHNGVGVPFPKSYTRDLKEILASSGTVAPTGCMEYPF